LGQDNQDRLRPVLRTTNSGLILVKIKKKIVVIFVSFYLDCMILQSLGNGK
jgi:hypothetical protein